MRGVCLCSSIKILLQNFLDPFTRYGLISSISVAVQIAPSILKSSCIALLLLHIILSLLGSLLVFREYYFQVFFIFVDIHNIYCISIPFSVPQKLCTAFTLYRSVLFVVSAVALRAQCLLLLLMRAVVLTFNVSGLNFSPVTS
jgi:hypothetical protein